MFTAFGRVLRLLGPVVLLGFLMIPCLPATAAGAAAGPSVVAVHRDAAVDVHGNSTFGAVAQENLAAGNWLITAKGEIFGFVGLSRIACQLVIGPTAYEGQVWTTSGGTGSVKDLTLLLGHHLGTPGKVVLRCYSDAGTGDVLIRDVQVSAMRVGTLTNDSGTFPAASGPRTYEHTDSTLQGTSNANEFTVGQLSLPAGRWYLQATAWSYEPSAGDETDCRLATSVSNTAVDTSELQSSGHEDWIGLEGIVVLSAPETVNLDCKFLSGLAFVRQSTIAAVKVGALTVRHLVPSGTVTTSGSGTPVVVYGYSDDAKAIATGAALKQTDALSLGVGSWLLSAKLSLGVSGSTTINCQLRLGSRVDNARTKADPTNQLWSWQSTALTGKVTSTTKAQVLCKQSSSSLTARWHVRIIAVKLGSLTDTLLP